MAIDHSEGSFDDLERARSISRRLRGQATFGQGGSGSGYIRFSSSAFVADSTNVARNRFGPAIFNEMLAWCVEQTDAELAFIVDMQGLIVTSIGGLDPALIEGIGARLLVAFDQADAITGIGEAPGSISIELGRRFLTGLRIRRGEGHTFIVGVLASQPVPAETREALPRLIDR